MQLVLHHRLLLLAVGLCVGMTAVNLTSAEERSANNQAKTGSEASNAEKLFPRFKKAGEVYRIEGAPTLDSGQPRKLVLDVTTDGPKDEAHSGLEHAARALNLYALADVPDEKVTIAVVIHSKATPIGLSDSAYRRSFDMPNPNNDLLSRLAEAGVDIRICGQALHHHGFQSDDIASSVNIDLSAMTALVELQNAGYALIPD
jgi:intracellular sulfur oxidation DsrE/DsrF family protein